MSDNPELSTRDIVAAITANSLVADHGVCGAQCACLMAYCRDGHIFRFEKLAVSGGWLVLIKPTIVGPLHGQIYAVEYLELRPADVLYVVKMLDFSGNLNTNSK